MVFRLTWPMVDIVYLHTTQMDVDISAHNVRGDLGVFSNVPAHGTNPTVPIQGTAHARLSQDGRNVLEAI